MIINKIDNDDKKFINLMKDRYNMSPFFNDDGFYFYDLKTNPGFKDAKITKITE